ncbi:MAG: hypothetical protein ACR2GX_07075 [Candidatus Dormibacteria bacterium]
MARLNLERVYDITPSVLTSILGARCHARCAVWPELPDIMPGVDAAFLPRQALAAVHPVVAAKEEAFCEGEYTSGRLGDDRNERWNHKVVTGFIDARLHACLHGAGPEDASLAELEWTSYLRYPQASIISEGVAECLVEIVRDDYRSEVGLVAVDARLLEARPIRMHFSAHAQTVLDLCSEVATALGTTVRSELCGLAADGAGQMATWRLAMRWSAAQLFGDPHVLAKPGAILDLRRSLENTLAGLRQDWVDVNGLQGRSDNEVGAMWARSSVRDFADTIRRIKAGPEGLPDINVFAAQLTAAAVAAQEDMEQNLNQVSSALEQLMAMSGDEEPPSGG